MHTAHCFVYYTSSVVHASKCARPSIWWLAGWLVDVTLKCTCTFPHFKWERESSVYRSVLLCKSYANHVFCGTRCYCADRPTDRCSAQAVTISIIHIWIHQSWKIGTILSLFALTQFTKLWLLCIQIGSLKMIIRWRKSHNEKFQTENFTK